MHPIGATHIDFGCVVCNTLLKQHSQASLLSWHIAQHKRDHPSCFDNSSITSIADCAHEAEKCLRVNQSLFQRNHSGDTDGFFDTSGEIAVLQCGRCSQCFVKKKAADDHVRLGRTKCSGSEMRPITGRVTIFGTVCPAPPTKRHRIDTASTAVAASPTIHTPALSHLRAAITPMASATPAAANTSIFNPYLGMSRLQFDMFQSTNPAVQRALRAAKSPFLQAESKYQMSLRMMKPFVPIGHDADDYAHMYADLGRPDDIVAKLNSFHQLSDIGSSQDSTFIIDVLIASVEEYFTNHAKDDVKRCWPNLRAMIQMTSATTDGEDNMYNGCFNFRRSANGLLKLAKSFIVFLWRSHYHVDGWKLIMDLVEEECVGDVDKAVAVVVDSGIIAEVLVTALLEPPSSAQSPTVISEWATAQMFLLQKGKNEYRICSPAGISKTMAAIHNLVRVGACTHIAKIEGGDPHSFQAEAEGAAMQVRRAVGSSWLAGQIRTWRDIEARTTSRTPPTTTDECGNVCIGSEKLQRSIICQLIPTVNNRLFDFFSKVISGTEWKDILDPTHEILFHRSNDGTIYFEMLYQNGSKRNSNSYFLDSVDLILLRKYESTIAGCVYICFHGFGGGSCRGQELYRTSRHDLVMSGGKLFYETISMKTKSKYIKTLRCLPPCTTRRVMVALVLYSGGIDGELFDLNFDQVDDAVANTYADVFQLTHRFCFQHSRQLYACIANTMKKKYPNHNYDFPWIGE